MHPSEGLREQTLTDLPHPEVKKELELVLSWKTGQITGEEGSMLDRDESTCLSPSLVPDSTQ